MEHGINRIVVEDVQVCDCTGLLYRKMKKQGYGWLMQDLVLLLSFFFYR